MLTKAKRMTLNTSLLLILAVLFVAITMLSNTLLRGVQLDLTDNKLYTISEGTRHIIESIDEPINLYFFFSDRATKNLPPLRNYANRVRELLEEFTLYADGKIQLQVIDPLPFSEEEDRASQFGLQAVPVGASGDTIFFGLAGTNSTDGLETISFFQPAKEAFLEYDLSKLIYNLAHPKKPVIGLLSTLPMTRGFDPVTRQPRDPWVIATQIEQLFEVRPLQTDIARIDDDVDVLMLVHPKDLPEQTRYAIDQFVLGGGKAIIFVDPNAEADTAGQDPSNPTAAMFAERASNLPALFKSWGIEMDSKDVIGDARYAVQVDPGQGRPPVRYLAILSVDSGGLNPKDVVTAELNSINFATAGYIKALPGTDTTLSPLSESSAYAMPIPVQRVRFLADPAALQQGFAATGEHYPLAVRVQGKAKSAFPDGPPGGDEAAKAAHLAEAKTPINVIVVADTDLLTDRLWVRVQNFFGQRIASAWANNGDFVSNALENLTGSNDLISIRGHATSNRPFKTVEALQLKAEEQFRATEQQLQERLRETERKLNELQADRDKENPLILSAAQRAELEQFQQEKLAIRRQLRQVRRDLDKDIERLGTTLKIINIGLMPLLVSICALLIAAWRIRRRKQA